MIDNVSISNNCVTGDARGATVPQQFTVEVDGKELEFHQVDRELCARTGETLEYRFRCMTPGERHLSAIIHA